MCSYWVFFFFQSQFLWGKLHSALTAVIYTEVCYWYFISRRKIKQPTAPQTKQSENEVTAVHLLLFLSDSVSGFKGSAGAALSQGAESRKSTGAFGLLQFGLHLWYLPRGSLCSVTFHNFSVSWGIHQVYLLFEAEKVMQHQLHLPRLPLTLGIQLVFLTSSGWAIPISDTPGDGNVVYGRAECAQSSSISCAMSLETVPFKSCHWKKQRCLPSNLTLVLLVADSGHSGVGAGIYTEAE